MKAFDRIKVNLLPTELVRKWKRDDISQYPREYAPADLDTDNISMGSQLIVNESQEAVFFKGGQALDVFGPGTHTLSTKNLPWLLKNIVNFPFDGKTPFSAEIFYVNKTANLNYKWGTSSPIPIEDPKLRVLISIGCYGQFGLRVHDSRVFVTQIVGTMSTWDTDKILNYFRGAILSRVKDSIAKYVIQNNQSLVAITAHVDDISKIIEERLRDEFAKYGLELLRFFVETISIPDEEIKKIQKGGFDRLEIDQLGDDRYKMKRSLDIMDNAANNTASAGTLMSAGVGFGVGSAMVKPFAEKAQETFSAASSSTSPKTGFPCPKCNAEMVKGSLFCSLCGTKIPAADTCPSCKTQLSANEVFCHQCGTKIISAAICPSCEAPITAGMKFCPKCGRTLS